MIKTKANVVVLFCMAAFLSNMVVYDIGSASEIACGVMINALAVDTERPEVIYVLTPLESSRNNVYRSIDGGNNWNSAKESFDVIGGFFLVVDPKNPQVIYAGGQKSIDGGRTWSVVDYGQGANRLMPISKLIIHPHNSKILYSLLQKHQ